MDDIKYMGSKNRIAKQIVPIIQKQIDNNSVKVYIEPFVGGSNMIEHVKCEQKIGGEENEDVWDTYYKNGKKQYCKAQMMIPPFNESKLK